jgi:A/G-specific adenine glycosylase
MKFSRKILKKVSEKLIEWFDYHGRRFPWRLEKDVYRIFIAEFLLQRTKPETVERVYKEFFLKYPSITSIASARIENLNEFFSQLGLIYRGERLKEISLDILSKFQGSIPSDLWSLLKLKGIGVYMASAVLNFGYGIPTPVVDKNVLRVLNRHFNITREIEARSFLTKLYMYGDHKKIAYALIDIGSLFCKEKHCNGCPLENLTKIFPLKKEKWRLLRKIVDKKGRIKLIEQPI